MKLHVLSDLHTEFTDFDLPKVDADILILAGDVGSGMKGIQYANQYKDNYEKVIFVPGNHEYYNQNLSHLAKEMREFALDNNIVFLDNDNYIFNDVIFIGSTLWTDFRLYGDDLGKIGYFMHTAKNSIRDFSCIRYAHMWFSPSHCAQMCITAQEFIQKSIKDNNEYKKVVITHHSPSLKSVHEKYLGNKLNPCFSNNLDSLVEQSDMWIHGHTHDSFDYKIGQARVLANPRGYTQRFTQADPENKSFNPYLVVEI